MHELSRNPKSVPLQGRRLIGQAALQAVDDHGEVIRGPIVDAGQATISKRELLGLQDKLPNEDAMYYDPENGIFAVFDGVGGETGGARASKLAALVTEKLVKKRRPEDLDDLAKIAGGINLNIEQDSQRGRTIGSTTCVIGLITEDYYHEKRLIFVSAGDSRIYVARNDAENQPKLTQVTTDDVVMKDGQSFLGNWLGHGSKGVRREEEPEKSKFSLEPGDRVIFCTDGIFGNKEEDYIPSDEFAQIALEGSAQEAANGLLKRATKKDDRTVIVVEV